MRLINTLILLLFTSYIYAQNLVPNPSFEAYQICPTYIYQVNNYVDDWKIFGMNPDYYRTCALGGPVGIPQNAQGWQYANTGEAYVGIVTYHDFYQDLREYIGVSLTSNLQIGTKYYVSFKTNLSNYSEYSTNLMGALFTTNAYCQNFNSSTLLCDTPSVMLLPGNNSQVFHTSVITDTLNWTTVSGSFVSDSAYSHLALGNFYNDISTSRFNMSGANGRAYYYLDDVCVSADSITCYNYSVGLKESKPINHTEVYPNPAMDILNVSFKESTNAVVIIYNAVGKMVFKKSYNATNSVDLELNQPAGLYFVQIETDDGNVTKKIVKE